ncbi:kinase-like protein [Glonium stellatum]|uniref:Kinase-like protein n=1 Tax=Glonium stellatum TaxID=574774 RepID=A0A8E2F0L7_9PEZI|nr:kinase-like protein [Glonium stellatum]
MALRYDTATNDEIVQHCLRSNPDRNVISELEGGLSIIRISEDAIVKCGLGVTEFEARNQQQAYKMIDPAIIRIPRVYRFFAHGYTGYIVMEYVNGQSLSTVEDPNIYLEAMVKVLKHFEKMQHDKPGPFHGGLAYGQLWLDYDLIAPTTISDVEEYYNRRQLKALPNLNLKAFPLVFCHLDIAPRNILVLQDGSLCLVDWATAGFYPRLFERCALNLNIEKDDDWITKLLQQLDDLDEGEKSQARLLEQAYYLGQKYIYRIPKKKQKLPPGMTAPEKRIRGRNNKQKTQQGEDKRKAALNY